MAKFNPALFIRQIRQEMRKVTWPTRQETTLSSIMVVIFASIAASYFLMADAVISRLINWVLSFAG